MRLYELSEQYEILEQMLYDGETDEQTIRDTMEAIFGEFEDKANFLYNIFSPFLIFILLLFRKSYIIYLLMNIL